MNVVARLRDELVRASARIRRLVLSEDLVALALLKDARVREADVHRDPLRAVVLELARILLHDVAFNEFSQVVDVGLSAGATVPVLVAQVREEERLFLLRLGTTPSLDDGLPQRRPHLQENEHGARKLQLLRRRRRICRGRR